MKTRNWKRQKLLGLLGMTLLLVFGQMLLSCNGTPTPPSEQTARKVYENEDPIKSAINEGAIRVNGFRKTNGQMTEVYGAKMYRMEFEAEIEWLKDVRGAGKKGDIEKPTGTLVFSQTERGWKAERLLPSRP